MRGFSKAIVVGNLTRDPEMRTTPSGSNVCSFSIAVNRSYQGRDGQQHDDVSFINCTAWDRNGETISKYCHKGSGILVSGRLSQRSYEGKDGQRRSVTEVVVEDFNFMGGGDNRDGAASGSNNYSGKSSDKPAMADEGEMPEDVPDSVDLNDIPF